MQWKITAAAAAAAFTLCFGAQAADKAASAADTGITRAEAKDLKTESKGEYKARKHVAEANEELNKADCETSLDGKAERACKKDAKAAAKSDKAHAKAIHPAEEQQIDAAQKQ